MFLNHAKWPYAVQLCISSSLSIKHYSAKYTIIFDDFPKEMDGSGASPKPVEVIAVIDRPEFVMPRSTKLPQLSYNNAYHGSL